MIDWTEWYVNDLEALLVSSTVSSCLFTASLPSADAQRVDLSAHLTQMIVLTSYWTTPPLLFCFVFNIWSCNWNVNNANENKLYLNLAFELKRSWEEKDRMETRTRNKEEKGNRKVCVIRSSAVRYSRILYPYQVLFNSLECYIEPQSLIMRQTTPIPTNNRLRKRKETKAIKKRINADGVVCEVVEEKQKRPNK